jgi:hypothetical protein
MPTHFWKHNQHGVKSLVFRIVNKTKEKYYEHIESINSFVMKMWEKMGILEAFCLSN